MTTSPSPEEAPSIYKSPKDQELIKLALHQSPFFTCLDEEQLDRFVRACELKRFAPGEIVIQEGLIDDDDDERIHPAQGLVHTAEPTSRQPSNSTTTVEVLNESDESDENQQQQEDDQATPDLDSNGATEFPMRPSSLLPTVASMEPPPARSGIPRCIYIVRRGKADIWYQSNVNTASLGPGRLFGEGGFLFGRQHSASVVAPPREALECWVMDVSTFRKHVLPSNNMKDLFDKFATQHDEEDRAYMTMDDFAASCEAPAWPMAATQLRIANAYHILLSSTGSGPKIYLQDFCFFQLLMSRPDPEVDIAFLVMDKRQRGRISLEDLHVFLGDSQEDKLNYESEFFRRYFGNDGDQCIRHTHFSQFLIDLQREMGQQAFYRAVQREGVDGYFLPPKDFVAVLKTSCGYRLPHGVADRLDSIYVHGPMEAGEAATLASLRADSLKRASTQETYRVTQKSVLADIERREKKLGDRYFTYGDFLAFQEVLTNLPGICNLIDRAQEIKQGPVSADDFKVANRVVGLGGRLSRRQVDIVFQLFDIDRDGYVSHEDTVSVCGVDLAQRLVAVKGRTDRLTFAPPPHPNRESEESLTQIEAVEEPMSFWEQFLSVVRLFGLTAAAGSVGTVLLYPLDLVKTHMMNQRGARLYASSMDCLRTVLQHERLPGLYRGLTPQLMGFAPEKMIKLKVNALLQHTLAKDEKMHLSLEVLAGACAGACQMLVTNPMEICKIRLQLQGETERVLRKKGFTPPPTLTLTGVIRDLGLPGVYRGASACLLRDVLFGAIYFPSYVLLKDALTDGAPPTPLALLTAGTAAGIPAALLTSPVDLIKTRLQATHPVAAPYAGIMDCATKIYAEQGVTGFFAGSGPRVLRLAPQFGAAVLAYQGIVDLLGIQDATAPPTNVYMKPHDYRRAFLDQKDD